MSSTVNLRSCLPKRLHPDAQTAAQRIICYDAAPPSDESSENFDQFAEGYSPCGEGLEYH